MNEICFCLGSRLAHHTSLIGECDEDKSLFEDLFGHLESDQIDLINEIRQAGIHDVVRSEKEDKEEFVSSFDFVFIGLSGYFYSVESKQVIEEKLFTFADIKWSSAIESASIESIYTLGGKKIIIKLKLKVIADRPIESGEIYESFSMRAAAKNVRWESVSVEL